MLKTTHTKISNEYLNDILFHFNPYSNLWRCCNREHQAEMFNGDKTNIIESEKFDILIGMLSRYGSIKNIKEKLKNGIL